MNQKPILFIATGAGVAVGLSVWLLGWPAARSPSAPAVPAPAVAASSADALAPAAEVAAVTAHLKALFDRPEAPLHVNPVVMEGTHAVAGWVQGNMGGRALLQKRQGAWEVVVCAGDSLRDPATYVLTGMNEAAATRLAEKVRSAEAALPATTRHLFSLFSGSVRGQDHTGHKHTMQHSPNPAGAHPDAPAEAHPEGHGVTH